MADNLNLNHPFFGHGGVKSYTTSPGINPDFGKQGLIQMKKKKKKKPYKYRDYTHFAESSGVKSASRVEGIRQGVLSNPKRPIPFSDSGGPNRPKTPSFNPEAYARDVARLQYGGVISELRRELSRTRAQTDQAIQDIDQWYTGALSEARGARKGNRRIARRQDRQLSREMRAVAGLADEDIQGLVGNWGGLLASTERQISGIQERSDRTMQSQIAAERAAQMRNEQRAGRSAAQELQAALMQARGDMGLAQGVALQDARMMQGNLESQRLQNIGQRLQNRALRQEIGATAPGGFRGFDQLTQEEQTGLASSVIEQFNLAQSQGLRPSTAWTQVGDWMKATLGERPNENPNLAQWLANLWRAYITKFNQENPEDPVTHGMMRHFLGQVGI